MTLRVGRNKRLARRRDKWPQKRSDMISHVLLFFVASVFISLLSLHLFVFSSCVDSLKPAAVSVIFASFCSADQNIWTSNEEQRRAIEDSWWPEKWTFSIARRTSVWWTCTKIGENVCLFYIRSLHSWPPFFLFAAAFCLSLIQKADSQVNCSLSDRFQPRQQGTAEEFNREQQRVQQNSAIPPAKEIDVSTMMRYQAIIVPPEEGTAIQIEEAISWVSLLFDFSFSFIHPFIHSSIHPSTPLKEITTHSGLWWLLWYWKFLVLFVHFVCFPVFFDGFVNRTSFELLTSMQASGLPRTCGAKALVHSVVDWPRVRQGPSYSKIRSEKLISLCASSPSKQYQPSLWSNSAGKHKLDIFFILPFALLFRLLGILGFLIILAQLSCLCSCV